VLCKSITNIGNFLLQEVKVFFRVLNGLAVVMEILNKLVIGKIMIHTTVARFWDEFFALWISFFFVSAVNRLLEDGPPEVVIRNLPFLNWAAG